MNAVANALIKLFIRLFFPGLAKDLATEGQFDFRDKTVSPEAVDPSDYLMVEDNGSDVTIISFAGMAVLYAGMPRFEFRKMLQDDRKPYNLIFVRDIHRSCYYMRPDGSSDGPAFYEKLVGDALARLKSSHNVTLGASGGGAAAFCIGSGLPIHHIITFNPAFPLEEYQNGRNQWGAWGDVRKLIREPGAWLEVVLVMLSARIMWRRVCRLVGHENIPDIVARYAQRRPNPVPATIFYGERNRPDAWQARKLAVFPMVTLKPVDSARHDSMGDLKKRGQLRAALRNAIEEGIARLTDLPASRVQDGGAPCAEQSAPGKRSSLKASPER